MRKKILLLALGCLSGMTFTAGCAHSRELKVELKETVRVPPRRVLVFFVDGMQNELTNRLLREGRLPNIKKYLYDRGCHADYAVTSIPSITFAILGAMDTGQFPGHHEILGNKWFDRVLGQYQDYMSPSRMYKVDQDLVVLTIYEMLPDKYTVTIQAPIRRGATRPYDNWMSSGVDWFCGRYTAVDELTAERFEDIAKSTEITGRWPDYIFSYFPAVDHIGHQYGACSRQYQEAIIHFDAQIGRICRGLEKAHLLDKYYLILLADHGHEFCKRENRWMPDEFFEDDLNLSIIDEMFLKNGEPVAWQNYLKKYRIVVVTGGPRTAQIFLRCGEYWDEVPTFDQVNHFLRDYAPKALNHCQDKELPECLAAQPAVAIVAMKEKPNLIRIITHTGSARIFRQINGDGTKEYMYQPIQNDPLNYRSHKSTAGMVGNGFYRKDDWLRASCDSGFPDFVPQICEVFDSDRAGQIMLFASGGWAFSRRDWGGHGSVLPSDMNVPFMFAGPGIPKGSHIRTARVVDLTPTVLDMLGCSDRLKNVGPIDGKSLMPVLTAPPK